MKRIEEGERETEDVRKSRDDQSSAAGAYVKDERGARGCVGCAGSMGSIGWVHGW